MTEPDCGVCGTASHVTEDHEVLRCWACPPGCNECSGDNCDCECYIHETVSWPDRIARAIRDSQTDPYLTLVILGATPGPQGSKTAMPLYTGRAGSAGRQFTGRVAQFESSKKVKPWRAAVVAAFDIWVDDWISQDPTGRELMGWQPYDGPVEAEFVFSIAKPKATKFKTCPAGPPDLSKYLRATEDALNGRAFADDARVVRYRQLAKVWAGDPAEPDSLPQPGAVLRLYRKEP